MDECNMHILSNYVENISINATADHHNIKNKSVPENSVNCESRVDIKPINEKEARKPQHSFLRRGEGLRQRFKMDPDKFRLNNLPPYTYGSISSKTKLSAALRVGSKVRENGNKQTLKQRVYSKTEVLDIPVPSKNTNNFTGDLKTFEILNKKHLGTTANRLKSPSKTYLPLSWAQVLDSSHMKLQPVLPNDSLRTFELIEEEVIEKENQFQLFNKKPSNYCNSLSTDIPVNEHLQSSGLKPTIETVCIDESSEDDNEELSKEKNFNEESEHKTGYYEDDYSDSTLSNEDKNYDNSEAAVSEVAVETKGDDNKEKCYIIQDLNSEDDSGECRDISLFEHFKQALFLALQNRADEHVYMEEVKHSNYEEDKKGTISTLEGELAIDNVSNNNNNINNSDNDINKYRKDLLTRMAELEEAIATFKENNLELIKARKQFELEKQQFNQQIEETIEKFNDERMKFEISMHDEHMKLEKEKQKIDQQLRIQKSFSKDCKEKVAMKEEINELKEQLKQKDINHNTSQARLRMQIRTLEKGHRQLTDEIANLSKENKKLQVENMLIRREGNNKMLQEINRNIARLAPKSQCESSEIKSNQETIQNNKNDMQQKCDISLEVSQNSKSPDAQALVINNKEQTAHNKICKKIKFHSCQETVDSSSKSSQNSIDNNANSKPNASLSSEFKREIFNKDGSKDIWYPNGNIKKISADGMSIRMLYFNKDIKETNINDGMVKYYYADSNVWHTTYLDGLEILEFPNGQIEHRHKNGCIEVHFPNNSIKIMNPNDEENLEEWRLADGTNLVKKRNGDKILVLPNGQKEVHTKICKRREYPDGTVKLIYPDGSQESRYSNGRIRLKDKAGNLIMDNAS